MKEKMKGFLENIIIFVKLFLMVLIQDFMGILILQEIGWEFFDGRNVVKLIRFYVIFGDLYGEFVINI